MSIYKCENCYTRLQACDRVIHQKRTCPKCGHIHVVPINIYSDNPKERTLDKADTIHEGIDDWLSNLPDDLDKADTINYIPPLKREAISISSSPPPVPVQYVKSYPRPLQIPPTLLVSDDRPRHTNRPSKELSGLAILIRCLLGLILFCFFAAVCSVAHENEQKQKYKSKTVPKQTQEKNQKSQTKSNTIFHPKIVQPEVAIKTKEKDITYPESLIDNKKENKVYPQKTKIVIDKPAMEPLIEPVVNIQTPPPWNHYIGSMIDIEKTNNLPKFPKSTNIELVPNITAALNKLFFDNMAKQKSRQGHLTSVMKETEQQNYLLKVSTTLRKGKLKLTGQVLDVVYSNNVISIKISELRFMLSRPGFQLSHPSMRMSGTIDIIGSIADANKIQKGSPVIIYGEFAFCNIDMPRPEEEEYSLFSLWTFWAQKGDRNFEFRVSAKRNLMFIINGRKREVKDIKGLKK